MERGESIHRWMKAAMQVMAVLCGASLLYAVEVRSAPASPELRGKSVIVSWTEHRSQRRVGKANFNDRTVTHELRVYVSTEGRAFNRMTNRGRSGSASNDQIAEGGGGRNFEFGNRTMIIFTGGRGGGARRIVVQFNAGFGGCQAEVIRAREVGASSFVTRSMITGKMHEIRSVSVSGVSCSVKLGNVFAGN